MYNIKKLPHDSFSNIEDYNRYKKIIKRNGDVAVYFDFSHIIRLNGEICRNHGRW